MLADRVTRFLFLAFVITTAQGHFFPVCRYTSKTFRNDLTCGFAFVVDPSTGRRRANLMTKINNKRGPMCMSTSFSPTPRGHVGVKDKTRHVAILDKSLKDLTGHGVYERMGLERADDPCCCDVCLHDRYALISHGTEADPVYNYGNVAALQTYARSWEELCHLPSSQNVVNNIEDEEIRMQLTERVSKDGYIEGATGIRVTGDGKQIRLVDVVIWNCYDENGDYYGQAALFDRRKVEEVRPITANLVI